MAPPPLVITDAGLKAINSAQADGLDLVVESYKLGDGYNYIASPAATGLQGNEVYPLDSGGHNAVSFIHTDDENVEFLISVDADAGPFDFGEIALYLSDEETLFALGSFEDKIRKESSIGGAGGRIVIRAKVNLLSAKATVTANITELHNIPELADYSLLPKTTASDNNLYIVNQENEFGKSALAHREIIVRDGAEQNKGKWTIENHQARIWEGTVSIVPAYSSTSYLIDKTLPLDWYDSSHTHLIQFTSGNLEGLVRRLKNRGLGYDAASKRLSWVGLFPEKPDAGSEYEILASAPKPEQIYSHQNDNRMKDHSQISITTGSGLSGGGDLTVSRSIKLDIGSLEEQNPDLSNSRFLLWQPAPASGSPGMRSFVLSKLRDAVSSGARDVNIEVFETSTAYRKSSRLTAAIFIATGNPSNAISASGGTAIRFLDSGNIAEELDIATGHDVAITYQESGVVKTLLRATGGLQLSERTSAVTRLRESAITRNGARLAGRAYNGDINIQGKVKTLGGGNRNPGSFWGFDGWGNPGQPGACVVIEILRGGLSTVFNMPYGRWR